jgi:hypothetical protein
MEVDRRCAVGEQMKGSQILQFSTLKVCNDLCRNLLSRGA